MRVPRRQTTLGVIERLQRRAPAVVATPLAGGASGPTDYGIVESLPTGTIAEGSLCTFKAAAGVYWRLIYTGEATYPWAKIGGPPIHAFKAPLVLGAEKAYATPAEPVELTLPLAGDYDIKVEYEGRPSNIASDFLRVSYAVGATAANAAWSAVCQTAAAGFETQAPSRKYRHSGVAKSALLKERYLTALGGEAAWSNRHLWANPMRVG